MKRTLLVVGALVLVAGLAAGFQRTGAGDIIYAYFLSTPEVRWKELGPITVQQAYPAVGDRDYTTVDAIADANILEWDVPNDASGFMFYFETTADGDSQVVNVLISAGTDKNDGTTDDNFLFGGSLALTGGTQTGSNSNVIVDTVVATDGVLNFSVLDSGNNRVCLVQGDTKGFKRFRLIAPTLAAKTEIYWNVRYY